VGAVSMGYGLWDLMSDPEGADTAWNATALPLSGGGAVVLSGSF